MNTDFHWQHLAIGKAIINAEEVQLQNVLVKFSGKQLICMAAPFASAIINQSPIQQRYIYGDIGSTKQFTSDFIGSPVDLPLLTDSIDVFVAPHCFDGCDDPHSFIKDVHRALAPEGRVVITGFNSSSLFGLPKSIQQTQQVAALLPINQVRKLLLAYGFILELFKTFYFRPMVRKQKRLQQLKFFEMIGDVFWPSMGCVYLFVAKKSVLTLTPTLARRVKLKFLTPKGAVEPTTSASYNYKKSKRIL